MLTDRSRVSVVPTDGGGKGRGRGSTGEVAGLSVHARVMVPAGDAPGRERLARYCARLPFAEDQVALKEDGRVVFTPTRRKPHAAVIALDPVAFVRRVAALVPPPAQHQLRHAGILAPAAKLRALVVPKAKVEVRPAPPALARCDESPAARSPARARWARLIHRVYVADAPACPRCGGHLQLLAHITDPLSIRRILEHLRAEAHRSARAPP